MGYPQPLRGYSATKDQLIARLHRIAGQIGGIERMVDEERYCIDVPAERDAKTDELMAAVGRLMHRG